jgi:hypothetical protein
MNKNKFIGFILLMLLISCNPFDPGEIVLTRTYISNEAWDDYNNQIKVEKMQIRDSVQIIRTDLNSISKNFTLLQVESAYIYEYSGFRDKRPNPKGKVYFNKDNGWKWVKVASNYKDNERYTTIGNLQKDQWYRFSNLRGKGGFFIYAYVDQKGDLHQYYQDLRNGP